MQYTIFLLLVPISLALSVGVLAYALRRNKTPEILALIVLTMAVSGWLTFNSFELIAVTPEMTLFWAKVTYLFIGITPVAWLAFALQYTGTRVRAGPSAFWLFGVIPLITVLLLWFSPDQHLVWRSYVFYPVNGMLALYVEYGPWFYVHIANAYAVVIVGAAVIVLNHFRSQQLYRGQSRWLLVGALMPVFVNLTYVSRLVPGLRKDFTPIGFALSGLAFAMGIFWHRLFDVQPIARATLVDSMRDCVITLDGQNRVLDLNPAAVALFSRLGLVAPIDSYLGTSVLDLVGGWTELAEHLSQGIDEDVDLAVNCNGEQLHYACSTTELAVRRGRKIGHLIVLRDITDRKTAEATLRQQMEQLQISNEQLDAFAHTAAHDLKGPLSIIIGYVEMLGFYLDELTKDEIRQYLGLLNDTGRQMSGIIDSLLLLAQVHRQDNLVVDLLDMETVVADALRRVDPVITGSGAAISMPESWPNVVGYGPWLLEAWVNYLLNAIKYGGSPPSVTLGYECCEIKPAVEAGGEVDCIPGMRFWVRDNGQGLTEDQMTSLFTPFMRFHTDTLEGHGLGLSIVHRIIDRLGGQVGVESEVGVGSTFWFTLPTVFAPDNVSE